MLSQDGSMKHIKLFEKFKEFDNELLTQDINGILIELKDKGFNIITSIFKPTISIVLIKFTQDGTVLTGFKIDDIDSYILTLVDYMKYKLGNDIYIEYFYCDEYTLVGGFRNVFKVFNFSDKNRKVDSIKINFTDLHRSKTKW